jgi:hypothetical protein
MKYLSQPIANSTNSKMHLVELQHKLMEAQGKDNIRPQYVVRKT